MKGSVNFIDNGTVTLITLTLTLIKLNKLLFATQVLLFDKIFTVILGGLLIGKQDRSIFCCS